MRNSFYLLILLCIIYGCHPDEPAPPPPECNADCTKRPDFGEPVYNYTGTVYLGGKFVSVRLDSIGGAGRQEFLFCNLPDSVKINALRVRISFQPVQVCLADSVGSFAYAKLIDVHKL